MNGGITKIIVTGFMTFAMYPAYIRAQERVPEGRERELSEDIKTFASRAAQDNVISTEERDRFLRFVSDSLPEQPDLRISILEQLRDKIDSEYDKMLSESQESETDFKLYGKMMVPKILTEPEDFKTDRRKRLDNEKEAALRVREHTEQYIAANKPLKMHPLLRYALCLLFGRGTNHSPELWDREVVIMHGGLYNILLPGGKPSGIDETIFNDTGHFDPSIYKKNYPQMEYDPHPDRHFRR